MVRPTVLLALFASFLASPGCADDAVVLGSVEVKYDETQDFTQFQTFSVVTSEIANPPDLDPEQEAFNDQINLLIVEAMQAEPVCMTFIPPDEVSDTNQPDLWAANGAGRETEGGYVYECCGGWWWGYWGWYWDPCAYWCPTYVEYDIGSLLILAGRAPDQAGQEPVAVFGGLAQSVLGSSSQVNELVRDAVRRIFQQWPVKNTCPAP